MFSIPVKYGVNGDLKYVGWNITLKQYSKTIKYFKG